MFMMKIHRCNGTLAQLRLCEEACEERLASLKYKARVAAKNLKRKATRTDKPTVSGESVAIPNAKTKTGKHSLQSSDSNDSNATETKRRKAEKLVENKVDDVVDTSKDDVTIFVSNLDYRYVLQTFHSS